MQSLAATMQSAIEAECLKLIRRFERYATGVHDEARRRERRTEAPASSDILRPIAWRVHSGFDPYHVRRNAAGTAYAIARALKSHRYQPRPAIDSARPKADGTDRVVSTYQVADSAVSRLVFKQLLRKNASRLSARCYAYRQDVTLHDAVAHIAAGVSGRQRVFVAEFDFSKFFDAISHEHINKILRDHRFYVSPGELRVIRAFLSGTSAGLTNYATGPFTPRITGIPQGTSISLFLANIAAYPLDRRLESLGVGFVRYADDTLIWADNYDDVCRAADAIGDASREMGVDLNIRKSEGISILVRPGAITEFRPKHALEMIGYRITASSIGIKASKTESIKKRIAYLIFSNLLEPLRHGQVVHNRFSPPVDRDYVVMIRQIRRYLYGNLSEENLRKFLNREAPGITYRGLMSFYPILTDRKQLTELDGWMFHTIRTTLRLRTRMLNGLGITNLPTPHGLADGELLALKTLSSDGTPLDLRIPSFRRIAKLIWNASEQFGPNEVSAESSGQYYIS